MKIIKYTFDVGVVAMVSHILAKSCMSVNYVKDGFASEWDGVLENLSYPNNPRELQALFRERNMATQSVI